MSKKNTTEGYPVSMKYQRENTVCPLFETKQEYEYISENNEASWGAKKNQQ